MINTIVINNKLSTKKIKLLNKRFMGLKSCLIKFNLKIKDRSMIRKAFLTMDKKSHLSFSIIDFFIENGYKFSTKEIIQLLKLSDAGLHNSIYLSIKKNIYIQLILKRSPYICHYIKEYGWKPKNH